MGSVKVLFLGANARNTTRLRVGAELSDVRDEIAKAGAGDCFHVDAEFAVRPEQLQGHLQKHLPEILHFSGHGAGRSGITEARSAFAPNGVDGLPQVQMFQSDAETNSREFMAETADANAGAILLEDRDGTSVAVRPEALTTLIAILQRRTPLRCVVLNACFTKKQAMDLAQHVDCVIGMKSAIDDAAAIAFAVGFYRALAKGNSIKTAFDYGCNEIDLRGLPDKDVPELHHRSHIRPESIRLQIDLKESRPNVASAVPGNRELVLLVFAASPDPEVRARSEREVRQIQERLLRIKHGPNVIVHVRWEVCPDDILPTMLDLRPRIVHFSGYTTTDQGILLRDGLGSVREIDGEVLVDLFGALRDDTRLVFLNAQNSQKHAEAMTQRVDTAIGMAQAIEDAAATTFASTFYQAIAAGLTLKNAFEASRSALNLNGLPGASSPVLLARPGVDVSQTILFQPTERLVEDASSTHAHGRSAAASDSHASREPLRARATGEPADLLAIAAERVAAAFPDEASFTRLLAQVGVSYARIPALRSFAARSECLLLELAHADGALGLDKLVEVLFGYGASGIAAATAVLRFATNAKAQGPGSLDTLWISVCRRGDGWLLEFRAPGQSGGGTVGSTGRARVAVAKDTVIQVDVKEAGVAVRVQAGAESPLIGLKARVRAGLTSMSKQLIPWFDERLGPAANDEFTLMEATTSWSELENA